VAGLRFGWHPKSMIQGHFYRSEDPKPMGFSHGQLGHVVEPLHATRGGSTRGTEPAWQQRTVSAGCSGDFLHGLDRRALGVSGPGPGMGMDGVPSQLEDGGAQVPGDFRSNRVVSARGSPGAASGGLCDAGKGGELADASSVRVSASRLREQLWCRTRQRTAHDSRSRVAPSDGRANKGARAPDHRPPSPLLGSTRKRPGIAAGATSSMNSSPTPAVGMTFVPPSSSNAGPCGARTDRSRCVQSARRSSSTASPP